MDALEVVRYGAQTQTDQSPNAGGEHNYFWGIRLKGLAIKGYRNRRAGAIVARLVATQLAATLALTLTATLLRSPAASAEPSSVDTLMAAIEREEDRSDAYALTLGELYYALGRALSAEADHSEALDAFQTGMQVERINYGLNALSQLPYLFAIADSHRQLGEVEPATDALYSLYHIAIDHYGEQSEELLPTLSKLLDWQLTSYALSAPRAGFKHLIDADKISAHQLSVLLNNAANSERTTSSSALVAGYRQVVAVNYTIAEHLDRHGQPGDSGLTFSTGSSLQRTAATNSQASFRNGKMALEQVVMERERGGDPAEMAEAVASLGDWYLMFGQQRSADDAYRLAYQLTQPDSDPDQSESGEAAPDDTAHSASAPPSAPSALGEALFALPRAIHFGADENLTIELPVAIDGKGRITAIDWPQHPVILSTTQQQEVFAGIKKLRCRPRIDPQGGRESLAIVALPASAELSALLAGSAPDAAAEEDENG